jgi:hypothetical protein
MALMMRVLLLMAVAIVLALTIPQRTAYLEQLADRRHWSWPDIKSKLWLVARGSCPTASLGNRCVGYPDAVMAMEPCLQAARA